MFYKTVIRRFVVIALASIDELGGLYTV